MSKTWEALENQRRSKLAGVTTDGVWKLKTQYFVMMKERQDWTRAGSLETKSREGSMRSKIAAIF